MVQVPHTPLPRALARLRAGPFDDLPLAPLVDRLLGERGHVWRDRLLPPLVTLRLFVLQVLHGNVAVAALRQLAGVGFSPSSYCDARDRLPMYLIESLVSWLAGHGRRATGLPPCLGRRVLIADGSSCATPDTPRLRAAHGTPGGQRPGIGYPAVKLMGLLDAATGLFERLLPLPVFEHDARSVVGLHPALRAGDILLGDRAFCSFAHVALLDARGVFGCFRLHQRRRAKAARGTERWAKPKVAPAWMGPAQFAALPASVLVRLVSYAVPHKGFRTERVVVATTLLDESAWPDDAVARLYGRRWDVETCFRHLKTTLRMDALRCRTPAGVAKELAVYLLAYNLVRLAVLKAAAAQGVGPDRVSFVDAARRLAAMMLGLPGVARLVVNPRRPGRTQLRVIRRRLKEYDLLVRPRREEEAIRAEKAGRNP